MTSPSTSPTESRPDGETPSLPPSVRIGEVIAGKYRIERVRGAGGMGIVVEARHLPLDLPVAIKFMSPQLQDVESGVVRFMREARATARIHCEHVVRVFDVASLDDGTPYIVMEFLEGEDLGGMLQRRGRLPVAEAVDYIVQACVGVAEAHAMGIVHRDLKPGNLFCCSRPNGPAIVKVLDFGVSKLLPKAEIGLRTERTTGPHVLIGSPVYSAPEQLCEAGDVDARADVWALGAVLYELVAGRPPFFADTLMEVCSRVVSAPYERLGSRSSAVGPELEAVVGRSLAKDREQRFATVSELAAALAPFAPRRTLASMPGLALQTGPHPVSRSRAVRWCIASAGLAALLAGWAATAARFDLQRRPASGIAQAALVAVPSFTRARELPPPESVADEDDARGDSARPAPPTSAPRSEGWRSQPPPPDARLRPKKVVAPITATR